MADFDTGDVVRLGAKIAFDSTYDIVNVFNLRINSGGNLPFATASLDLQEWLDDFYGYLTTYMVNDCVADSVSVKNETQDLVFGSMSWGTWSGGGHVGDPTPPGVALLGFCRTKYSRVQIRKYLGVFTDEYLTSGYWNSTIRGACDNAMSYLLNQQTMTNGLVLQGVAYNPTTGTARFGLTPSTSQEPVYQRRRRRGRGS